MIVILLFLVSLSFASQDIVAKVNGTVISRDEFERLFNLYRKEILHFNPSRPTMEDKRQFLFEYIKGLIVEDVAKDMGLSVEEEEIDERLRLWGRKSADPFLRRLVRRELLVSKLTDKLTRDVKVSEGEIKAYYLLNRREFYYPDQVKLLRVITETKSTALRVYKVLKEGNMPRGGKSIIIGRERWYSLQALPKIVRRKLYPYRVGVVSKPIRLETGYLILKITDRRKAGVLPLDEVRDQVRAKLLKIKRQEVMREWFREVLKSYSLEIYLKNLE